MSAQLPGDEPAFPCEQHVDNDLLYTGMSISDVFAAVAMHALIGSRVDNSFSVRAANELAESALLIARSMLKARTEQGKK